MSALNICIKPDRCIVLQDAAAYDPEGRVTQFMDKGQIVRQNGLFVAATGLTVTAVAFAQFAERFVGIDHLASCGEAIIDEWYDQYVTILFSSELKDHLGVLVAFVGWSEEHDRPMCVVYTAGIEGRAFAVDVGTLTHPQLEGAFRSEWMAGSSVYLNIDTFDAVRDGRRLMELQRAQPARHRPDRSGQFLIGGHVKLTEVFRDRIEQRVLHEWTEDVVGERIRPAPRLDPVSHPNVAALTANRAERRRIEKLQRRGAA
ncbi:hypothetical protein [Aureimonas sp. ME7]|uniref:hypothetical protein n=1 Tax=Aureimonas sp. ME7 TaxID=2744252 RepID=UPI0015FA5D2A|nr:hypothetical protein [Aureimonas sp. ME7]